MVKRYKDKTKEEVLQDITSYLNEQLELCDRLSLSRDSYDKGSWPYFQADCNGQKRILRKILEYLK